MKKKLSLLSLSLLLASQTQAAPYPFEGGYGFATAPNGMGSITVSLSGDCTFSKSYSITDAAVYLNLPQHTVKNGDFLEISFRSVLGNFLIAANVKASKDKASINASDSATIVKTSSTERAALHYLISPAHRNRPDNYVESMNSEGEKQYTTVTYGNLFDALLADTDFGNAQCSTGLLKNRFLFIAPQLNSATTKVKTSANYSSVLDSKTSGIKTSTTLNTTFSTPIQQPYGSCTTKAPLAPDASSYSFSCTAAAKPIVLSVSIVLNASETFDASDM